MATLESAIPLHLQKPRKCPMSMPPSYKPPFPSYCARFPTSMSNLVMAIIGAQYSSKTKFDDTGIAKIRSFVTMSACATLPSFWESTSVTDKRGSYNIAIIAYWPTSSTFQSWKSDSGFDTWWQSNEREKDGHGWFQEVLFPSVDRFETVFSNNEIPEGAANMREKISGEIGEHGYWGSMRDRLPAAQDDRLEGEQWTGPTTNDTANSTQSHENSRRVRVPGKKNLCVIRSGQDWSATLPAERKLYLETMHPVLVKGMTFLRDEGKEIGCYANNLWDVIDSSTYEANLEKTYGLGFFDDLSSLEQWSKSHQTHIDIFGGFLMYAKKLNNVLSLRLFHEIYVLEEKDQSFEYVGCHKDTGMLNAN
ncbi:heme-containing dehydratase protein [Boeremia exigua]|uniref:heme-containing dehydratase protein n=1 Tax=Boeremia exigua TaxID=749465 RepID=UPI001E8DCF16|nr:heme-containing dehydratase protein [Boeremia exigua]KAH6612047.1 heme-containing dehydratase protein [Boeremia exigua]